MDDHETPLTQDQAFSKAHELLKVMQGNTHDDGKAKGNAVLLAYDPEREAFQMVSINADPEEIMALVLGCFATVKNALKNISEDRTLN